MTPLLQVLLGVAHPGLIACALPTPSYRTLAEEFGRQTLHLSTGRATTKSEMLTIFATELELADWFGHNLDAAHEALHDRLGDKPNTLVIVESPPPGTNTDRGDANAFISVIDDVLVERQQSGLLIGVGAPDLLAQIRS